MNFTKKNIHFWTFLLLCGLVSNIFTILVGIKKYAWKNVIHTVFLLFNKKSSIFVLREICKRTCCPSIVNLALLLFYHYKYLTLKTYFYCLLCLFIISLVTDKKYWIPALHGHLCAFQMALITYIIYIHMP